MDKNFTQVPNDVLETLAKINMPVRSRRILDVIKRHSYGYHLEYAEKKNKDFVAITGISKSHVSDALKWLVDKGIISSDISEEKFYKINDVSMWKFPNTGTKKFPSGGTDVPEKGNSPINRDDLKKTKKEKSFFSAPKKKTSKQPTPHSMGVNKSASETRKEHGYD